MIEVTVKLPNDQPVKYAYHIRNALDAIPAAKKNVRVIQNAMMDGLRSEIGNIIEIRK